MEAGGEAVAARIGELWASPFHTASVHADQEILRATGKAVAVEIGGLMGDARLTVNAGSAVLGAGRTMPCSRRGLETGGSSMR